MNETKNEKILSQIMLDIDRDNFFGNIRILEDDIPSNEYY